MRAWSGYGRQCNARIRSSKPHGVEPRPAPAVLPLPPLAPRSIAMSTRRPNSFPLHTIGSGGSDYSTLWPATLQNSRQIFFSRPYDYSGGGHGIQIRQSDADGEIFSASAFPQDSPLWLLPTYGNPQRPARSSPPSLRTVFGR